MTFNINKLNQNNQYALGKPIVNTKFSSLEFRESTTTTGDVGNLIPIFIREMQPNQTMNVQNALNIQFTPFVTNLMHQIKGEINHYFVPHRIIWSEWETFITGGTDGLQNPTIENFNIQDLCNSKKEIIIAKLEKLQTDTDLDSAVKNLFNNIRIKLNSSDNWTYVELFPNNITDWNETQVTKIIEKMENIFKEVFMHTYLDYIGIPIIKGFTTQFFLRIGDPNFITRNSLLIRTLLGKENLQNLSEIIMKKKVKDLRINKFPIKAINKIYNDWYRLLDWESEEDLNNIDIHKTNWDWNYLTRTRMYQIRGAMPTIPVEMAAIQFQAKDNYGDINSDTLGIFLDEGVSPSRYRFRLNEDNNEPHDTVYINNEDGLMHFDDLMTAAALMNYYTANARTKPRYAEQLLARWKVNIQDSRLQMAEYIGSDYIDITSQGIVQTSNENQGKITGQLWGQGSGLNKTYQAQEHGFWITLLTIKPAAVYELGFNPMFRHENKFDFATPEFVNLPDTPIYKDEIDAGSLPEVFGYKTIYDEYRTSLNKVTGLVRPSIKGGLGSYTLAQLIKAPTMEKVAKCNPDMERIKQYLTEPDFILIIESLVKTAIPIPYQSNPELAI